MKSTRPHLASVQIFVGRGSCLLCLLVTLNFCGVARVAEGAGSSAATIVEKADRIRFPKDGFQVDIKVDTTSKSGGISQHGYRILSKGNDRTLVLTTAPVSDKGQMLLMRDKDLWVFLPSVSQPVRLPLSQKLTGQVANGDLARANFTGDYTATLLREERIEEEDYYVLALQAARRGVTYDHVTYWVHKKKFWPYKAEFYAVSNRLLKTAYYRDFKKLGDQIRPTHLVLEDGIREGEISTLDYSGMKLRGLDDKVFTKQYLQKLQ